MPDLISPRLYEGTITAWKGTIASIPVGWSLCDGVAPTPDLRAKFIIGASDGDDAGDIDGEDTVILTEAELAAHSHSISDGNHGHATNLQRGNQNSGLGSIDDENASQALPAAPNTSANGTGATLNNAGSGTSHENMPSFYETIYIMKTVF